MEGVAFGHGSAGRDASACGGSTQQDPCEVSPVGEESGTLYVEVCLKSGSTADRQIIREHVRDALSAIPMDTVFESGEVFFYKDNSQLGPHVDYMTFDLEHSCQIWQAQNVSIHVFQLSEEGPYDETTEEDQSATAFTHWELPCVQFKGLWDSLMFETDVKMHLLEFASTSLLFSANNVDANIISWNHVVLLHGPPGTGKTSLCQALAQKLSIRLGDTFKQSQLLEINSHSLFSKWFSESGKLVSKLFSYIHELAEDEDTLVCILIDEVESLAAARTASMSGSEPSDSIRVVNALLTQIDRLKSRKNVMILTTSNITDAIDVAFVDRADIRQFIGLPSDKVRRQILYTCIVELARAKIVVAGRDGKLFLSSEESALLDEVSSITEGLSGRGLRKLPFQAHARYVRRPRVEMVSFLGALLKCAQAESVSREALLSG